MGSQIKTETSANRALRRSGWGAGIFLSAAWLAPLEAQFKWEPKSAHSGVYTEEQADSGAVVFSEICSQCHGASYPLWGSKFMTLWGGKSLFRVYEFLSLRMPYGKGGTLTPAQYRTVTAYILRKNNYPAGSTLLPDTPLGIGQITLDPHPAPAPASAP